MIDFDKIQLERWEYIKFLFPKTYEEVREWNFSIDEKGFPYGLWISDRDMYNFFDWRGIYVCPIINEKNEFYIKVYTNEGVIVECKNSFKSRRDAEFYGFVLAFDLYEKR